MQNAVMQGTRIQPTLDFGMATVLRLPLRRFTVAEKLPEIVLRNSLKEVPSSRSGRIRWVAERLYPLGRCDRAHEEGSEQLTEKAA
jgi:hypothetical protein